ncbi:MAG: bifunctional DNA primase/polymerase [Chloroflexi bacterium]|nr:bifunctional DNA primase/polymerase [Chloroflexota bacterium]
MNVPVENALAMAATGWRVIPLHTPIDGACDCHRSDCSSPGKHPRTKNGLSDATTDADQIRKWWGMWPTANIGAVVPDGFIVVDLDVADLATVFKSDELPRTATSRTGRGRHLIYRTTTLIRPKVGVREHVDLRGPGSYIVVPPSLHISGVRYGWVVPIEDGIADAPAWVADAAQSPRAAVDRPDDLDLIPEGKRNAVLASLAGAMRRPGMTAAEIEPALLAVNAGRCQPPLSDDEVRAIAASVGRYPPGSGRAIPPRPVAAADDGDPAATDDPEGAPESEPGDPGPVGSAAGGKQSQATQLLDLVADVEFFHTADDVAYARIERDGHHEVWPLGSKALRAWLSRRFHQAYGRAAGGQALRDALDVLMGRALFEGSECPVYVRVAGDGNDIYLDLGDPLWHAVRITATGWEIVADPPVRFRRPKGLLRLPAPIRGGSVDQLRRFVNVRDDDQDHQWRLFIGCLVAAFRPSGPYPILALNGEHGSAKSTSAKIHRRLIDPNKSVTRAAPRDERDLAIAATNGAVISLDNLSSVPDWLSDTLCRVSTGLGFSTRTLYENDEETLFDACRPIVVNGIGVLGTRSDLLDRTIELELPRIPDERRQDEAQFWAAFDREQPAILGALLDAVSGAVGRLDQVQLERAPRMADFARWVVAAEPALGWPAGSFLKAYTGNRDAIHEIALDAAVIVPPMRTLLESGEYTGTATELLDRLAGIVGESAARRRGWPGSATSLSRELARIAPNLRSVGIEVEKRRESHGRRVIAIRLAPETPSPASPPSPARGAGDARSPAGDGTGLPDEPSVTQDRTRGDTGDAGDGPSPLVSPTGMDVAREALRIFADDLTDESAARLRAVVDGPDGFEWGGLA